MNFWLKVFNLFFLKNNRFGGITKRLFIYPYYFAKRIIDKEIFISLIGSSRQENVMFGCLHSNFHHIFIADQYHAREYIKIDSVVIDAGANIGFFSILASKLAPKGKVFSFEPAPKTFTTLKRYTTKIKNIFPQEIALGSKRDVGEIGIRKHGSVDNSIKGTPFYETKKPGYYKTEKIIIESLDNFVQSKELNKIDFIKIDVEGYEKFILQGAQKTISKFLPVIAISAYHNKDDLKEIPKIIEKIAPSKYDYFLSTRSEEDYIFTPKK